MSNYVVSTKTKKISKLLGIAAICVALYFVADKYLLSGLFKPSVTIAAIDLPTAPENAKTVGLSFAGLPSSNVTTKPALPEVTIANMAWNSQLGLHFANGGVVTTEGSLMEKAGVKLTIVRQDDIVQAGQNLIKFAKDYKDNPSTAKGQAMFAMMGDGSPSTLAAINKELRKLGDDYIAQVFFSCGLSYGEDALLAPTTWRQNPQNARGGVVATVIRDGDWNIVVKWASDNNIPINPDEKTWDANAINFINASTNVDAGVKYITGYKETRKVVRDGVVTNEKKEIEVNAVSVWTPVDVNVAMEKGGLVRIVSTKEYSSQMPNVVIGIKKWAQDNRVTVENIILAATQGGDQVKSYSSALNRAGEISASIYNENDGEYWVKYAKGVTETDKTGLPVELGGSKQFNLADNLNTFGIAPNTTNTYAVIYKTFGKIAKDLYPEIFKDEFAPVDEILDLSYLRNVQAKLGSNVTSATNEVYNTGAVSQIIAEKSYTIEFATGQATLTPAGEETMQTIYESLIVANGLKVDVTGFTDNVGGDAINQSLSEARANTVKRWLQTKSSANFPDSRINTKGLGSANPIADNSTSSGRAKNRRVDIKMGR